MLDWLRRLVTLRDPAPGGTAPLVQVVIAHDEARNADEHRAILDQQRQILKQLEDIETNIASYRAEVRMNARAMGVAFDD